MDIVLIVDCLHAAQFRHHRSQVIAEIERTVFQGHIYLPVSDAGEKVLQVDVVHIVLPGMYRRIGDHGAAPRKSCAASTRHIFLLKDDIDAGKYLLQFSRRSIYAPCPPARFLRNLEFFVTGHDAVIGKYSADMPLRAIVQGPESGLDADLLQKTVEILGISEPVGPYQLRCVLSVHFKSMKIPGHSFLKASVRG